MKLRFGRVIIVAIAAEVLSILALVLVVALTGPADRTAAQVYAQETGLWLGPLAGFLFCLLGGYWVARAAGFSQVLHGLAVGIVAAIIDVILLVVGSPAFSLVFLLSNAGRVAAGALGGWLASRAATAA